VFPLATKWNFLLIFLEPSPRYGINLPHQHMIPFLPRGRKLFYQIFTAKPLSLREANKKELNDIENVMAYHSFQMTGQFLTDNYIFDNSCCFRLLEKLGY
jgi:hypothetical protein